MNVSRLCLVLTAGVLLAGCGQQASAPGDDSGAVTTPAVVESASPSPSSATTDPLEQAYQQKLIKNGVPVSGSDGYATLGRAVCQALVASPSPVEGLEAVTETLSGNPSLADLSSKQRAVIVDQAVAVFCPEFATGLRTAKADEKKVRKFLAAARAEGLTDPDKDLIAAGRAVCALAGGPNTLEDNVVAAYSSGFTQQDKIGEFLLVTAGELC